jgi:hypothetical protein
MGAISQWSEEDYEDDFENLSRTLKVVRHFRHGVVQTETLLWVYFQSFFNVLLLVVVEFLENWPRVITDPFGSFLIFVVIPVGNGLLVVGCSVWIIARFLYHYVFSGTDHSRCMSQLNLAGAEDDADVESSHDCSKSQCKNPTSLVNWPAPQLFDARNVATNILEGLDNLEMAQSAENFDFESARALLLLSSFVYESEQWRPTCFAHAVHSRWGLNMRIVDMGDAPKRTAFILYSEERNVIIVCFKGTNPFNIHEIYVDASVQKVDGRPFVFGGVHQSLYNALFAPVATNSKKSHGSQVMNRTSSFESELPSLMELNDTSAYPDQDGENDHCAYERICSEVQQVVRLLHRYYSRQQRKLAQQLGETNLSESVRKKQPRRKPKMWVTGHSLGGALATLFYARMLKSQDVRSWVQFMGGYTFGAPRVGNFDFAQEFEGLGNSLLANRSNVKLWRVVNGLDIGPRLPMGQDTIRFTRLGSGNGQSSLDFFHVGKSVYLHASGEAEIDSRNNCSGFGLLRQCHHLALLAADYAASWTHVRHFVEAAIRSYRNERKVASQPMLPTADYMSFDQSMRRRGTLMDWANKALEVSRKCVSHVEHKPGLARKAFKAFAPSLLQDHTPAAYLKSLNYCRENQHLVKRRITGGLKNTFKMFVLYLLDDETTQKLQEKVRTARVEVRLIIIIIMSHNLCSFTSIPSRLKTCPVTCSMNRFLLSPMFCPQNSNYVL